MICPNCRNDDMVICEHGQACPECEQDENVILLEDKCIMCIFEGKVIPSFDQKPRDIIARAMKAIRLGKERKRRGLPPPQLKTKYSEYYELFMEGYFSEKCQVIP